MANKENPELIFINGHTKITSVYRGTTSERDPKKADKILHK